MANGTQSRDGRELSPGLRTAVTITAVIDVIVGLAFLFAPETGFTPWPTAISPVLLRFIGSIILGNGIGAWLVARQGTWESARALFTVALVYGVVMLVALPYHLLAGNANPILWAYFVVDLLFIVPIGYIYWTQERSRSLPMRTMENNR